MQFFWCAPRCKWKKTAKPNKSPKPYNCRPQCTLGTLIVIDWAGGERLIVIDTKPSECQLLSEEVQSGKHSGCQCQYSPMGGQRILWGKYCLWKKLWIVLRFDGDLVKKFLNTHYPVWYQTLANDAWATPFSKKGIGWKKNILGINKSWCISLDSWKMKKAKALQDVQIRTVPRRYLTFPHWYMHHLCTHYLYMHHLCLQHATSLHE